MSKRVEVKEIKSALDIKLGRPGQFFVYVDGDAVAGPMSEIQAHQRAKELKNLLDNDNELGDSSCPDMSPGSF